MAESRMWEVNMWMRCCAVCKRVLRKASLAIAFAASAAGSGNDGGNPNRHREYLMQHSSAPRAMRDIKLTCQYRSTLPAERELPGMVRYVLIQQCIADALTCCTDAGNEIEVVAIGARPPTRIDSPAARHREHDVLKENYKDEICEVT